MIIRELLPEDLKQFCKVSSSAFVWKIRDLSEENLPSQPVIGAFSDDGVLMAQMEFREFDSYFGGNRVKCIGVGGVATMPEYRNRGLIRALFDRLEEIATEKGYVAGYLFPFSFAYYRKFGYEGVNSCFRLDVPISELAGFRRNNDVTLYEGKEKAELLEMYNKYASQREMIVHRETDERFFRKPFETCQYTYIWRYSDGSIGAYVSFSNDRAAHTLIIEEIAALDKEAMSGILGFMRNYAGAANTLSFIRLPACTPLLTMLPNICAANINLYRNASARIYNIEALLKAHKYPSSFGKFSIKMTDNMPVNCGIFDVEYSHGQTKVTRRDSGEYDVAVTPASAVLLLMSDISCTAETARYLDGVEINGTADDFFRAYGTPRTVEFYEGF